MTRENAKDRVARCLKQVEAHPDSPKAHFNLGLAYTKKGLMDRAEKAYRKALELDAGLVEAWVNLGGVLLLKWDFQGSQEANRQALELRDDLLLAHYNMGQACLYLGDAEGLVHCNRRVIELHPDHAAGHYHLAVGLLATDRVAEARKALARAMALGHRPAPEFLRGLEQAGKQAKNSIPDSDNDKGAEAPENPTEE